MHILHVTPYYAPAYAFGGVVRAVEGLALAQIKQGHRVTVLTTDAYNQHQAYQHQPDTRNSPVEVIRIPNVVYRLRRFNLSTPLGFGRAAALLMSEADIVHLHEFRTVEALLTAQAASQSQRPVVLSPHGTLTYSTGRSAFKQLWDRLFSARTAQQISAVVGLNPDETAEAEALWRAWGQKPLLDTIPNGVEPLEKPTEAIRAAFQRRWGLEGQQVVLFLGRLHPRKGVMPLVEAFRSIQRTDIRLLIVGPDEGLSEALAAAATSDPRIVITGFLEGQERSAALYSADIFALPAVGEGLSMAALEAMAAGIPLVLSPGCHLPEASTAGAARIVAAEGHALAQTLAELLNSPTTKTQMGHAAWNLARERFTWNSVAQRWQALYERVKNVQSF